MFNFLNYTILNYTIHTLHYITFNYLYTLTYNILTLHTYILLYIYIYIIIILCLTSYLLPTTSSTYTIFCFCPSQLNLVIMEKRKNYILEPFSSMNLTNKIQKSQTPYFFFFLWDWIKIEFLIFKFHKKTSKTSNFLIF